MDTVNVNVCGFIKGNKAVFTTTTTRRDVMCKCGSAELYKKFCGRYDDTHAHTTTNTTNSNSSYFEVEGSQYFDLVLRYLAAVHHQQQQEVESVMDEICRGVGVGVGDSNSGCGGCAGSEVFKAVYQDAQRYELRGLMAHLLTRLAV